MKLSILIVNWNTKELVIECVKSIFSHPPDCAYEIIVVDNNSQDGSAKEMLARFGSNPQFVLLEKKQNLGFAKANNVAFQHSKGEMILLLNSDTRVLRGALSTMVRYFDKSEDCGILGPKILNPDQTVQASVRGFPKVWSSLIILSGLHRFFRPKTYFMDAFDYNSESAVDQVMGAALLTRRSVINQVGFLDDNFYLWYEEVDFCKRVKLAGFSIIYYPNAKITHFGAQSFSKLNVFARKRIAVKSLLYYFQKHGNRGDVFLIRFFIPFVLSIAWFVDFIGKVFKIDKKINV